MNALKNPFSDSKNTRRVNSKNHPYYFSLNTSYRRFSHARTCTKERTHQKFQMTLTECASTAKEGDIGEQREDSTNDDSSDTDDAG